MDVSHPRPAERPDSGPIGDALFQPFVESVRTTLLEMAGIDVVTRSKSGAASPVACDIVAVVELTATRPMTLMLRFPRRTAEALAARMQPRVAEALGAAWQVESVPVSSQVGSGSLPVDVIPSMALAINPHDTRSGAALNVLATRLRELPVPVVGRIADNRLLLDLRCLEDEEGFADQLGVLKTE